MCKAALFEIYKLRYGLKISRNSIEKCIEEYKDYKKEEKPQKPTPPPKVDFMPPSKPRTKIVKRKKIPQIYKNQPSDVLQVIDML